MQIVLKRTEKASPTKIDLRTSFLGIRWDPPVVFSNQINFFFHNFFPFGNARFVFANETKSKNVPYTIYIYIYVYIIGVGTQ